jgi:alcohol dehydrogenase class IV
MYMAVVPRPMPAAVASRCYRSRFLQLAYACSTNSRRGAQADVRGATQVLGCGAQAVARGAAHCLLHVLGRIAKTDACGLCFAMLPAKVSRAFLRLRHSRLACDSMFEVSRDAMAAGEE